MKRALILGYIMFSTLCLWQAVTREIAPTELQQVEYYCVLREYDGKIGIYDKEENLVEVVDYPFLFLNEYDRQAMETGVIVANAEELRQRIEDYTS